MDNNNKRSLDQIISGWLNVGQAIISIGFTIAMGLSALKHLYGFDLLAWIRDQIAQWKINQMVIAWHREHSKDGTKQANDSLGD